MLAAALVGCSNSGDVGCYYSPLVADVTVTVTGLSSCKGYSVVFLDEDEKELDTVALSSTCKAVYLPDAEMKLDSVAVQLLDSEDAVIAEETAERPYYDTDCYTGYDEVAVELATN